MKPKSNRVYSRQKLIRDAIVFGTQDHKVHVREKCIGEGADLTLEKAFNFERTCEISKQLIQSMEDKSVHGISKGRTPPPSRKSAPTKSESESKKSTVKDCKYCGQTHEFKRCPAYGETCRKCGNQNHFAVKCHTGHKRAGASSKKTFSSKTMHAVDTSDEEFFIGSVNVNGYNHDAEWYETVKVNNTNIHFQLDTGAKCNVLSSADLKKIDKSLKVVPTFSPLKSLYWYCFTTLCLEGSDSPFGRNRFTRMPFGIIFRT